MASFAQLEGRLIHERLSHGKLEKAAAGGYTGGWIAYGYKWNNGDIVVVKKQAAVVRRIFKWRAEGKSIRGIARTLNKENVQTQRGGKWAVSTLRRILRNPFYTGRIVFEGRLIPGQHTAIISDELFTAVNKEHTWDLK